MMKKSNNVTGLKKYKGQLRVLNIERVKVGLRPLKLDEFKSNMRSLGEVYGGGRGGNR